MAKRELAELVKRVPAKGPFLQFAVLCKGIQQALDSTLTLEGIRHTFRFVKSELDPAPRTGLWTMEAELVIAFGAGGFVGSKSLQVVLNVYGKPPMLVLDDSLEFEGPGHIAAFIRPIKLNVDGGADMSFDVFLGGEFVTRIRAQIDLVKGLA